MQTPTGAPGRDSDGGPADRTPAAPSPSVADDAAEWSATYGSATHGAPAAGGWSPASGPREDDHDVDPDRERREPGDAPPAGAPLRVPRPGSTSRIVLRDDRGDDA